MRIKNKKCPYCKKRIILRQNLAVMQDDTAWHLACYEKYEEEQVVKEAENILKK